MASELICRCRKRFASGFAIDADWRIPLEEAPVTVLFGPSAAGKTTLLRLIAGLEQPDSGSIVFRGTEWFGSRSLAPQQRRAGFLFQDYALFPHLTAEANVAYGAQRRARRAVCQKRSNSASSARAFPANFPGASNSAWLWPAPWPPIPRSCCSMSRSPRSMPPPAPARARTCAACSSKVRVPSIVVTHDRAEAIALGDWIAVLIDGAIRQTGPVREVFGRPADRDVAESLGVENILPAQIVGRESGLLTLAIGGAHLQCVDNGESGAGLACVRAEDVAITRDIHQASSARNRIAGAVSAVMVEGPVARVEMDCGFPLVALVTAQSAAELDLKPGDAIGAVVKATSVHLLLQEKLPDKHRVDAR